MSIASPVIEVTDATFESVVIDGSKQRPVVVDLWATWCGPCKTLGPILEKVAAEHDGDFLLAKLDVDANPMVAGALGVQSIPTVVAFRDGQPVDGFVGAYPEDEVKRFVDALLPSEAERVAEDARTDEQDGDLASAEQGYREALRKDPKSRDAAVGLGRILVDRGDVEEARSMLEPILPDAEAERILAAARVLGWSSIEGHGPLDEAKALAGQGRWREALDAMLGLLRSDEDRDEARAAMVDAFAALGDDDPLVSEYRRKLASALF